MKQILFHTEQFYSMMALLEDGRLTDFQVEDVFSNDLAGNIYKGVVKNAAPSINGVFVDIGIHQNAFLRLKKKNGPFPTEGQSLLVQVIKDATETKGPMVTDEISFPGKYAVLLPHSSYIGISRKIKSDARRGLLRKTAKAIRPEGCGLILRTASGEASAEELEKEVRRLFRDWFIVQKRLPLQKAPCLLHRTDDLLVRTCRDYADPDIEGIYTDQKESFRRFQELIKNEHVIPENKLFFYDENEPLFSHFQIKEEIHSLFDKNVRLPSGGSLMIEHTEALTAIDVNSGSYKGLSITHEDLAFMTNQEAAVEIARQIRLRNIGGMIIVDFLNMADPGHNKKLMSLLRREVSKDPVKTSALDMTPLGLVEMTRRRTGLPLQSFFFDRCPSCNGSGLVPSAHYTVVQIIEDLSQKERAHSLRGPVQIECGRETAGLLHSPQIMNWLKEKIHQGISIISNSHMGPGSYNLSLK